LSSSSLTIASVKNDIEALCFCPYHVLCMFVCTGGGGNVTALFTGSTLSTVQLQRRLQQCLVGRYLQVSVCLSVTLCVCL